MIKNKWNFAIGTTSRVPGSSYLHYLIMDIDGPLQPHLPRTELVLQRTSFGWHIYTPWVESFDLMLWLALEWGSDPAWVSIARKRGYAFLADKSPIELAWPVERMVIGK